LLVLHEGVKYNIATKSRAPIKTPILIGAVITTAEAEMTCKSIIGVLAVDLKETHSELSYLPDRV
jgi:hypothetical protein